MRYCGALVVPQQILGPINGKDPINLVITESAADNIGSTILNSLNLIPVFSPLLYLNSWWRMTIIKPNHAVSIDSVRPSMLLSSPTGSEAI